MFNGWFDQTIDRVSDRFTRATQDRDLCGSLLIALILQLDTAQLVNRLSEDSNLRGELVKQAMTTIETAWRRIPERSRLVPALSDTDRQRLQVLSFRMMLSSFRRAFGSGPGRWTSDNFFMKLLGIVLTADSPQPGSPILVQRSQESDPFAIADRPKRRRATGNPPNHQACGGDQRFVSGGRKTG